MYKLILERGYTQFAFRFHDEDKLKAFMFEALDTYIPDEDQDDNEKFNVRIEKCAAGGNPEAAHIENQE